jgi:hypothetical protein
LIESLDSGTNRVTCKWRTGEIQFLRSRFQLELQNFGDSAFRPHHADSAGLGLPALLLRISAVGFLEIKKALTDLVLFLNGAPGEIRTHDLQLRRLTLYPAELRVPTGGHT